MKHQTLKVFFMYEDDPKNFLALTIKVNLQENELSLNDIVLETALEAPYNGISEEQLAPFIHKGLQELFDFALKSFSLPSCATALIGINSTAQSPDQLTPCKQRKIIFYDLDDHQLIPI